jgi:glycosyltransferase involved in cell wall biosynthesis
MPNCIDFNKWDYRKSKKHENKVVIGWIGGGNHEEDLRIMTEVIPPILSKYKNVEFKFVHGVPTYLRNFDKRVKHTLDWSDIDKYPDFVASQSFDIGIAPLVYNKFNMSKSNLRWLEYSALKVPTVATRIEPYTNSIEHGKTGYLADTVDEWIESLSGLIEDGQKRKQIGVNAYISVQENYNLDKVTHSYIETLKESL